MKKLTDFEKQYIQTALWASTTDNGDALDASFSVDDLAEETVEVMIEECNEFYSQVEAYLSKSGDKLENDITDLAHDFWLTRNSHGAGFWDGDYPEKIGNALTKIAENFGSCELYVGDDGKIYQG